MNEHEQERIADAMNRLRPDWPAKQLRTLLADQRIAGRARRDVTVALSWVACEIGSASPYRVLEAGPWWKAAGVEGTLTVRNPRPEDACHNCGGAFRPDCCDNPSQRPAPSVDYAGQARDARERLHRPHLETAPSGADGSEEAA